VIDRYSRPQMARIWADQRKFEIWLEIEILAVEAMAELGQIPKEDAAEIRKKAQFSVSEILEIEKRTNHDVIAFLENVASYVGPAARWIHQGLTSSDILDTTLSVQLAESISILADDLKQVRNVIAAQARSHKMTPMIGRSHGVHAEPITFGLKLALWYQEMARHHARFRNAVDDICVGQISGAVGTFAQVSPKVEAYVCRKAGLKPALISNQIIQRDRHAFYFSTLALIGSSLEKFAVEVRHLQRTEVQEAEEPFTQGQKGSSAMPHKRNPILSENVSGLARLMRSYALAAMENVPLWHERDISHSSVERVIAPDATIALDFMLRRMTYVLGNLCVYPENMKRNLEKSGGTVFSEKVLLSLVDKGVARDTAYRMVQRHALKVGREGGDLKRELLADPEIRRHLSEKEVEAAWDVKHHLANVDFIFRRVFA
jgi:adenylosuccinate lyase